MTADIALFSYADQQVRTIVIDGEPWFVARDVCAVLDIQNARRAVTEQVDGDGVRTAYVTDSLGRDQETYIVSETPAGSVAVAQLVERVGRSAVSA